MERATPEVGGIPQDGIPRDWDQVTPEWMTAAVSGRHPGAEVGQVTLLLRDDGTTRRARLGLAYRCGAGPAAVFAKAEDDAHREVHARNGNLFNEADLYASGLPIPVEHPLGYHVVIDRAGLDYILVMEDLRLRDADPRDATRPLTVDQVADGIAGLGRLHSLYWDFSARSHPQLTWVQDWTPTEGFQAGLRGFTPKGLDRAADLLPPVLAGWDADRVVDLWTRYVSTLTLGTPTLLHGDAHIGNTYVLPDGTVGFLDWAVARRGNWSQDIGYFLIGALEVEDRRHAEEKLIDAYLDGLDLPGGQRPSRDEAWLRYRASPAYGLPVWLSTLGTDGWQPHQVSTALVERYATALADLDTLDALDRLRR